MPSIVNPVRAWIRRVSIADKLTALGIITSAASLAIASLVLVVYDDSSSLERLLRDTVSLAEVVGTNSTAALAFGDRRGADETLRVVAVNPHITSAAILTPDGTVLAHYERPSGAEAPPLSDTTTVRTHQAWSAFGDTLQLTRPIRAGRRRRRHGLRRLGSRRCEDPGVRVPSHPRAGAVCHERHRLAWLLAGCSGSSRGRWCG